MPGNRFLADRKSCKSTKKWRTQKSWYKFQYIEDAQLPKGTISSALSYLFPEPDPYLTDPALWAEEKLKSFLWSKQKEILQALVDHRMVAVKSCHGPGKSFIASVAGAWWLSVHELGSAFLVTTAPSHDQVEAILWREFRRRHREGNLPGRITLNCRWIRGQAESRRGDPTEELIGIGRKPQDYADEYEGGTTFQGIHARYFMGILDEGSGIDEWLWDAMLSLATNENSRLLVIGNPEDPNSRFAKVCAPGSGWKVIKISAWDTPNFTGEYIPDYLKESLTSKIWVEDRRKDWGEGSPIWTAKVEGEFPDISDEYLISPRLFQKAYNTNLSGMDLGRYGMDVARQGKDKTVIYRNRGGVVRLTDQWHGADTMLSAGRAAKLLNSHGNNRMPMNVDIIGVGAGVFDRLRERGFNVASYQGSTRAMNPKRFKNRRSEVYWTFRELISDGLIDLDPKDETLAAQLGAIKWTVDSAGRVQVETKDDMEKRGLPSPNHADAAVLSAVSTGVVRGLPGDPTPNLTSDLLRKVM